MDKAGVAIVISVLSAAASIWSAINSRHQADIADRMYRAVSDHDRVFDTTFLNQLRAPLRNGSKLNIGFSNMSTVTRSYDVSVRGKGMLVNWPSGKPSDSHKHIRLSEGRVAIRKDDTFSASFHVWFLTDPPSEAELELLIDDNVVDSVRLRYDKKTKTYARIG